MWLSCELWGRALSFELCDGAVSSGVELRAVWWSSEFWGGALWWSLELWGGTGSSVVEPV